MPQTVLVDFDGVLHAYSRGWDDGTAYDPPKAGALDALKAMIASGYEPIIFSTRPREQIAEWMHVQGFPRLPITNEKLPAVALIDDRAIRFESWPRAFEDLVRLYPPRP
jgi:hypothetical protein